MNGYFMYPELFLVVKLLTLPKSMISVLSLNSGSLEIAMNIGYFDIFLSSSMLKSKRSMYTSSLCPNSKCYQSSDYLNSLFVWHNFGINWSVLWLYIFWWEISFTPTLTTPFQQGIKTHSKLNKTGITSKMYAS